MTIQDRLAEAMKAAMRAKDADRLSAIRMMRSAIKNREIDARQALPEQEVIGVLSTLVKQRRESAEAFRQGGREELAAKEEQELSVIQEFLPSQLGEEEIRAIVAAAIAEAGALSMKDMGKVMKIVTAKTTGRADGRWVSDQVKAQLGG
jgi:uncharacterized protein YqeY